MVRPSTDARTAIKVLDWSEIKKWAGEKIGSDKTGFRIETGLQLLFSLKRPDIKITVGEVILARGEISLETAYNDKKFLVGVINTLERVELEAK